ncbi:glycosyltransferase [Streptomyces sp. DSM 44917]|uniref:Glycosyltransferase n=1 Tax=Streptomyces boetiae TaxID=3075541 RepID=A0ABU2LBJ4_9ACTN|nr:glycosyltransferase [Streptomyces sp. DSM 44917]MDT0308865.1 glycosyltransferase [Streptomyces sp. DSM 44917]
MTRILFATLSIAGHVRPGLPVARDLVNAGHEVAWYTGRKFEPLVSRVGATYVPNGLGFDGDVLHEMTGNRNGIGGLKRIVRELFIEPIPHYVRDLGAVAKEFRPDVIVVDDCFYAGPIFARQQGIRSVAYVVGPLSISSVDTAPAGTGMLPSSSALGRLRNRGLHFLTSRVLFRDVQQAMRRASTAAGFPPLDVFLTDWPVRLADRLLVSAVPEIEYPRSDLPETVEFVGPMLPTGVDDWTPPDWWSEVHDARRDGRPVVLLTQGTASTDTRQLILPAIEALAGSDALVVATAPEGLPESALAALPPNLRLERFIPYTELLPLTDVMVTNGGWAGVQMSLHYGVPLVTAGRSEDKMEVGQRVAYSGAGLSLNTSTPSAKRIRAAVNKILTESRYRERAQRLKAAYQRYPGAPRATEVILEVAGAPVTTSTGENGRPA